MEDFPRVTFVPTQEEINALEKAGEKKANSPRWYWGSFIGFLIIFGLFQIYFLNVSRHRGGYHPISHFQKSDLILPVIVLIGAYCIFSKIHKEKLDVLKEIQHPMTIWLEKDGFYFANHTGEGRQRWDSLHDITESASHLFVWVNKMTAYVIPKKAFETADQAEDFVRVARRYWDEARCLSSDQGL